MGIGEAEAFSERLKRELLALEAANVHAILESEPLIDEVSVFLFSCVFMYDGICHIPSFFGFVNLLSFLCSSVWFLVSLFSKKVIFPQSSISPVSINTIKVCCHPCDHIIYIRH